jgi:hypothetical protein
MQGMELGILCFVLAKLSTHTMYTCGQRFVCIRSLWLNRELAQETRLSILV